MYELYQGSGGELKTLTFGKCIRVLFKNAELGRKRFKGERDFVFRLKEKVASHDVKSEFPNGISHIPEWLPSTYTVCRKDSEEVHAAFFGQVVNEYPTVNKIIFNCNGVWQFVVEGKEVNLEELLIDPQFVCSRASVQNICQIIAKMKYCNGKEMETGYPDYNEIHNYLVEYFGVTKRRAFRSAYCQKVLSPFATTSVCRYCQCDIRLTKLFDMVSDRDFSKDDSSFTEAEEGNIYQTANGESEGETSVEVEESEQMTIFELSMKEILADKSETKTISHLKLQAGVINNKKYLLKLRFVKRDLKKLCEAYDLAVSKDASVKDLNDILVSAILRCDTMPIPDVLIEDTDTLECFSSSGDTTESPSRSSKKSVSTLSTTILDMCQKDVVKQGRKSFRTKNVGQSKKKTKKEHPGTSEESKNSCSICLGYYDDSPDWIQCDGCDEWVHGECVDIKTLEQWEKFETEDFLCPFCQ